MAYVFLGFGWQCGKASFAFLTASSGPFFREITVLRLVRNVGKLFSPHKLLHEPWASTEYIVNTSSYAKQPHDRAQLPRHDKLTEWIYCQQEESTHHLPLLMSTHCIPSQPNHAYASLTCVKDEFPLRSCHPVGQQNLMENATTTYPT